MKRVELLITLPRPQGFAPAPSRHAAKGEGFPECKTDAHLKCEHTCIRVHYRAAKKRFGCNRRDYSISTPEQARPKLLRSSCVKFEIRVMREIITVTPALRSAAMECSQVFPYAEVYVPSTTHY